MTAIITLTTDFGADSPYVAQMKGAVLSIFCDVQIIDVTHSVPPQDILQGALALVDAAPSFPPQTIHVAVVDPGVGTQRRIVAAQLHEQWFIAPDNGLLTGVWRSAPQRRCFSVENNALFHQSVSRTFHGRDIMAPVAAHLAAGVAPDLLGPAVDAIVEIPWPEPIVAHDEIRAQIIAVDSFGNLLTNLHIDRLPAGWADATSPRISCGGAEIDRLCATYGDARPGELVALFGSADRLEIAVVDGSAAARLQAGVQDVVTLRNA
ncbi:MAG: SAM-dependent chlorinase/fluorinase [Planctomycetales bacterium]|nr:SAM-dependent chlorinase/fluorinase [Planctomycetales bacterium]